MIDISSIKYLLFIFSCTNVLVASGNNELNETRASGIIQICGFRDSGGGDEWTYSRIVGGVTAKKSEFKWQITIQTRGRHMCGGSVIGRSWVITAAHCLERFRPRDLTFVAGDHRMRFNDKTEQTRRASSFIIHEKYNTRTQENDIALVKTTKPFDFSTLKVAPACLPTQRQVFKGNCVVTGWGKTRESGSSARTLQKVWVPLVSDSSCQENFDKIGYHSAISNTMICAGRDRGGKDACQGDSGGPLVCPGRQNLPMLVGIVSWGVGCARRNVPGVYTEVAHFVSWIEKKISNYRSVKTKENKTKHKLGIENQGESYPGGNFGIVDPGVIYPEDQGRITQMDQIKQMIQADDSSEESGSSESEED